MIDHACDSESAKGRGTDSDANRRERRRTERDDTGGTSDPCASSVPRRRCIGDSAWSMSQWEIRVSEWEVKWVDDKLRRRMTMTMTQENANAPMRGWAMRPLIGPASHTRLVACSDSPS